MSVLKRSSLFSRQPTAPAVPAPAKPKQQPQPELGREMHDPVATRQAIFDNVLQAARTLPPLANQRHTLQLADVDYDGPDYYDLQRQKQAILAGGTLGRRLVGTWKLTDNATGAVLDQKKQMLARVPFMTDRGTFIHNGTEYAIRNQLRMRPGVFVRQKENGEIEAHANILPGHGVGHRYFLDPAKGTFYLRLHQAKIPLIPLLRALGANDKQLMEAWGPQIFGANQKIDDSHITLNKLFERLIGPRGKAFDDGDRRAQVLDALRKMQVEPEVMQRTLGKPYANLDTDALLDITKKLLSVSRGEQDVDDRDHLAFQTVHGPEDLLSERLAKDYGGLRRGLLHKASFKGNLKPIYPGALTRQLEAVLLGSGLGNALEETNLAEVLDKMTSITKMGVGGLGSLDAVPDESRSVQPSHLNFIDLVRTPESSRIGIDLYLSAALRKGKDGRVYAPFIDPKTNQTVYRSPQDIADLTIALPGEMKRTTKRVGAMRGGQLDFFPRSEVDLVLPPFENAFSPLAHFVPMKSASHAQRMAMGSRMATQALALEKPEAPLVQVGRESGSFEEHYGSKLGAIKAKQGGHVLTVTPDGMTVRYDNGERATLPLYNNFVLNRKSFIHNTPLMRPGQRFEPNQLLAKSNYTDDRGRAALGINARVGYLPFKGLNFEDATAVSESFARRASSEHAYQHTLDLEDGLKTKKRDYISLFAGKYDRKTLESIDDDGVIKPGTPVQYGDPLILAARPRSTARKVHRKGQPMYADQSQVWEYSNPGVVTDVSKSDRGINVVVKSLRPMQEGDKLSGRFGDKGVIAQIVPDDQMPTDAQGRPLEVVVNDLGVITRRNPAQAMEAVLGKIAERTGQPYAVKDFEGIDDLVEFATQEAGKHGIQDLETVTDPETGRGIPNILVGNRFFMKLAHQAEDKLQGRGFAHYTQDETPAKGGAEGSKKVGLLLNNALLAHGAYHVMHDVGSVRGQRNEPYWLAFMQGLTPPQTEVPYVYRKFVNQLRGSGINVIEDGSKTHIMAMTNKDVQRLAGDRLIESGETLDFTKGMQPIAGGLFDEKLTGGPQGNRWSAIKLHEPLLNPVMEDPARRLLGLTKQQFEDVLAGREKLPQGGTGPAALQKALANIDLDKAIVQARLDIASGRKTKRDVAVRKLEYLKAAKKLGIGPGDWVLDRVPVLPPMFRPVSTLGSSGLPLVADANYLYKELIEANKNLQTMSGMVDDVGDERVALYHAFKAVTGLGDPVHPKLREKKVKGLLAHIFGGSPKHGTVQQRLIGSAVDLVGRAVIVPDPDLDMDQVGLPEDKAWHAYKPFVVRRLRRRGMKLAEALRQVSDRSKLAKQELLAEMSHRPVTVDRAPAWHKFSVLGFWPRLVKGDTMHISPLVVKGFAADFDGDMMNFNVPGTDEARQEIIDKLLPSKNLLSPADFKTPVHQPSQEYTGGLYAASAGTSERPVRTFATLADAIGAFRRGTLDVRDRVRILS